MERRVLFFLYGPKNNLDFDSLVDFYLKLFPNMVEGSYNLSLDDRNSHNYLSRIDSSLPFSSNESKKDLQVILKKIINKDNEFLPRGARLTDSRDYWVVKKFLEENNKNLVVGGDTLESKTMSLKYEPQDLK